MEYIPSKEEVLSEIAAHCEKYEIKRELSDDTGVYLLEVVKEGGTEKQSTVYTYQRKGSFPNGSESIATVIHVAHYRDGTPVGGDIVSEYNPQAKKWEVR